MAEVDLEAVRAHLGQRGQGPGPVEVGAALRALGVLLSDTVVHQTVAALRRDSVGAGVLDPLLHLPGVTDVLVNGPDQVYLDRGAGLVIGSGPILSAGQPEHARRSSSSATRPSIAATPRPTPSSASSCSTAV